MQTEIRAIAAASLKQIKLSWIGVHTKGCEKAKLKFDQILSESVKKMRLKRDHVMMVLSPDARVLQ